MIDPTIDAQGVGHLSFSLGVCLWFAGGGDVKGCIYCISRTEWVGCLKLRSLLSSEIGLHQVCAMKSETLATYSTEADHHVDVENPAFTPDGRFIVGARS